jgi:hypothetical protein
VRSDLELEAQPEIAPVPASSQAHERAHATTLVIERLDVAVQAITEALVRA